MQQIHPIEINHPIQYQTIERYSPNMFSPNSKDNVIMSDKTPGNDVIPPTQQQYNWPVHSYDSTSVPNLPVPLNHTHRSSTSPGRKAPSSTLQRVRKLSRVKTSHSNSDSDIPIPIIESKVIPIIDNNPIVMQLDDANQKPTQFDDQQPISSNNSSNSSSSVSSVNQSLNPSPHFHVTKSSIQTVSNIQSHPIQHQQLQQQQQQALQPPQQSVPINRSPRLQSTNSPKRIALVSVLSCVLQQLFSNPNDTLPRDSRLLTRFHTEQIPNISIGKYLERIAQYSECSDEALVMALIHISRISHNKPNFHLNALSIHRLFLTSILCSSKFFDDSYYNNHFFSRIGGVSNAELNCLEVDFLELTQFELWIDEEVYSRFVKELRNPMLHPKCNCSYQQLESFDMLEHS